MLDRVKERILEEAPNSPPRRVLEWAEHLLKDTELFGSLSRTQRYNAATKACRVLVEEGKLKESSADLTLSLVSQSSTLADSDSSCQ